MSFVLILQNYPIRFLYLLDMSFWLDVFRVIVQNFLKNWKQTLQEWCKKGSFTKEISLCSNQTTWPSFAVVFFWDFNKSKMIFNLVQMMFVSSFTKIPHSGEKHCGDGDFWVSSMLKPNLHEHSGEPLV